MPANFLYAGLIHAVFPKARIIHMQPPSSGYLPVDLFSRISSTSVPYANDLEHLAHYYGEYLRLPITGARPYRRGVPGSPL